MGGAYRTNAAAGGGGVWSSPHRGESGYIVSVMRPPRVNNHARVLATGGCAGDGDRFHFTCSVARFYRRYSVDLAQHDGYRWKMKSGSETYTVAKHLQRAGYCHGTVLAKGYILPNRGTCVIVQWDGRYGVWDTIPAKEADQTGFRMKDNVLEALREQHLVREGWGKNDRSQCGTHHGVYR